MRFKCLKHGWFTGRRCPECAIGPASAASPGSPDANREGSSPGRSPAAELELNALNALAGYAVTCRRSNTQEWIDEFVRKINNVWECQGGSGSWHYDETLDMIQLAEGTRNTA